jgi:Xaa-Pro aminopeptidase
LTRKSTCHRRLPALKRHRLQELPLNHYRERFRQLLARHELDYVLVYGNSYDDRFLKAIAGTQALQQNYIILSRDAALFTASRYYLLEMSRRTDMTILPADGESFAFAEVLKKVGTNKCIGIVGHFKHADVAALRPANVVDLTAQAHEIILHKTDEYISALRRHARTTFDILNGIRFRAGETRIANARRISHAALEEGYTHAFSTCITSGRELFTTTTVSANQRKIHATDMVCVDMGLRQGTYTTDITRMFFVNHPQASKLFKEIAAVHNDIIATFVSPEKTFRQVIAHYQQRFEGYKEVSAVPEDDFGHGIGFALHEEPILEKTSRTIGRNIVFTLEPTFVTRFGRMRIEDMIGIYSDGRVVNLTGGRR